jgi:hypothetical protein
LCIVPHFVAADARSEIAMKPMAVNNKDENRVVENTVFRIVLE